MQRRLSIDPVIPMTQPNRTAATLVEVLMSLLIFGVGVVSVFALFPLSIISSVRATQLTHGRIMKDNVQELIHTLPEMVRPPVGAPWSGATWRGTWQPLTQYRPGDVIFPTIAPGKVFPKPYFALRASNTSPALSSAVEPVWNTSQLNYGDGGVQWQAIRVPNYVVDPFGYFRSQAYEPKIFGYHEGMDASNPNDEFALALPRRTPGPIVDFDGNGVVNQQDVQYAENLFIRAFSSPDSWSVQLEQVPIQVASDSTSTSVTFPAEVDASGFIVANTNFPHTRIILTSLDGTRSVVRYPTGINTGSSDTQIILDQQIQRPNDLLGPARVETFTTRYSYFLTLSNYTTVAPRTGDANADELLQAKESLVPPKVSIAVVFNRRASPDAEYAYLANFGNRQFTANPELEETGLAPDEVKITWTSGEPDPFLKTGTYILDARKLIFYRVTAIRTVSNGAILTVDHPIEVSARTRDDMGPGLAIIMPGIVHVYNLEGVE